MKSGGKRRRQATVLRIIRERRVPHQEALRELLAAEGFPVAQATRDPVDAPDKPHELELGFEAGVPVTIDGRPLSPLPLLLELNELGSGHGVGRAAMVDSLMANVTGTVRLCLYKGQATVLSREAPASLERPRPRLFRGLRGL